MTPMSVTIFRNPYKVIVEVTEGWPLAVLLLHLLSERTLLGLPCSAHRRRYRAGLCEAGYAKHTPLLDPFTKFY